MRGPRGAWAAVALALLAPAVAQADSPPPPKRHVEVAEAPRTEGDNLTQSYFDTPYLTLRWHPIQLISGVMLVGAEVKILRDVSALVHVGGGRVKAFEAASNSNVRKNYFQTDLEGRYYLVGDMSGGLYGGAGVGYSFLDTDQLIASALMNMASGLRVGPSMGGNYMSPVGISVDLQFLFHYRVYRPEPSLGAGTDDTHRAANLLIGAALALGYTF